MLIKFDILVDLSLDSHFSFFFFTSLSPSVFKVGRYAENSGDLDLMIDISSQPDLGFLIDQIKNYVSILNNS